MLKDLGLISEVPPWYSKTQAKPSHENGVRKHYGMYGLMQIALIEVRANRIGHLH